MSGVARRLGSALAGVLASTIFVFVVLRMLPGDIATARLGTNATPEALEALREQYGLNRSFSVQYLDWLGTALRGDLGISLVTGDSVRAEIFSRLDVTLPLIVLSSLLAVLVAMRVGQHSALHRKKLSGLLAGALSQLGLAVPTFVVGVGLIFLFAVRFRLLPAGGFPTDGWTQFVEASRSMVLPVLTLSLAQSAVLVRFARSQSLDFLASDAYRTARAAGRTTDQALSTATRLVLSPVLTVTALQLSTLLTGAVVVETVFALPGVGSMTVRDIANRDVTKVQSTLLILVVMVFAIRLVIETVNDRLDPRRSTQSDD